METISVIIGAVILLAGFIIGRFVYMRNDEDYHNLAVWDMDFCSREVVLFAYEADKNFVEQVIEKNNKQVRDLKLKISDKDKVIGNLNRLCCRYLSEKKAAEETCLKIGKELHLFKYKEVDLCNGGVLVRSPFIFSSWLDDKQPEPQKPLIRKAIQVDVTKLTVDQIECVKSNIADQIKALKAKKKA